ncbi:gp67 [Sphingomonas phage PAU]|uniref:gp67 n=1 Tax=Sphingomonas phage PAU TaxID=1150991 RepID=UPI00025731CD|nr:gp67 [Sphingomonas phage PAU]AFF28065.1 gp67 [Sphingomonas phage PAU]
MAIQLTRVSQYSALEVGETFGSDLNDIDLYVYDFNNSTGKQVLGADNSNNSRNYSTSPYLQNVFLKTTPRPYIPDTYHDSREISTLLPGNLPMVQFQKLRLHMSAGWTYPSNIHGMWFRIYVKINEIDVTLASIVDEYFDTRLETNSREYVLENQVFTQHIEVDVLDINFLFSQKTQAFQDIINIFTNGQQVSYVSDLMIEFGFIDNDDMVTFVENGFPFERFSSLTDYRNQIIQRSTEDSQLFSLISLQKENPNYLDFKLAHSTTTLQAYFEKFKEINEEIDIFHQVTFSFYDSNDVLLSTDSIELRNFSDQYASVSYIPHEYYTSDHILVRCVSRAVNSGSGQTWIRVSELAVLTADLKPSNEVFQFDNLIVKNEITKIEHKLENSPLLPEVVEIYKPVYYVLVSKEQPEISISPFDSAFAFDIDIEVVASKKLSLRIGERVYEETSRTSNSVIFNIKALEYYRKEKEYYIVDGNLQEVFRGKVTRYGEQ